MQNIEGGHFKYGIITHYDVHNHGALLQLNALVQVLKEFGVKANALQFDKNYDFMGRSLKSKYEISIKSVNVYLKYLMERGLPCFIYNYGKKRILEKFKSQKSLIGPYYTESDELDGVIVGSDEVFALHTGPTPAFFGHALPSNNVFAYGGCFGPTTIKDIDKLHCRAFVKSGLEQMRGLGMRDKNSVEIAKELTGGNPELVCDPVILYGYESETSNTQRPMQEKYMVVYAYDVRMNDSKEIESIKRFAKKHDLKIVSPGFYHKWVDRNVNTDPIELLGWFKHAEFVVTDTFHGCVMSIITGRDMAIKMRDNGNKLQNLLEEYQISERIINDDWKLEEIFSKPVDWKTVNMQIIKRREASKNYLERMLLNTKND